MRTLTEAQATHLEQLLHRAERELREHAAQHSYRADACRAIGERLLATYHRQRHAAVLELAAGLAVERAALPARRVVHRRPALTAAPALSRAV